MIDTLLNIGAFVTIGLLIWLYFKKVPEDRDTPSEERDGSEEDV